MARRAIQVIHGTRVEIEGRSITVSSGVGAAGGSRAGLFTYRRDQMNSPEQIRAYQEAQREAGLLQFIHWFAQVIVTPLLLILILWRVW